MIKDKNSLSRQIGKKRKSNEKLSLKNKISYQSIDQNKIHGNKVRKTLFKLDSPLEREKSSKYRFGEFKRVNSLEIYPIFDNGQDLEREKKIKQKEEFKKLNEHSMNQINIKVDLLKQSQKIKPKSSEKIDIDDRFRKYSLPQNYQNVRKQSSQSSLPKKELKFQNSPFIIFVWISNIRKIFFKHHQKKNLSILSYSDFKNEFLKLNENGQFQSIQYIPCLEYEKKLTSKQILKILQENIKKNMGINFKLVQRTANCQILTQGQREKNLMKYQLSYIEIIKYLVEYQFLFFNSLQSTSYFNQSLAGQLDHSRHKFPKDDENYDQIVETARFQEGKNQNESKRVKKTFQKSKTIFAVEPKFDDRESSKFLQHQICETKQYLFNTGTEANAKDSEIIHSNVSQKSKQSLNPLLNAFNMQESKSIQGLSMVFFQHEEEQNMQRNKQQTNEIYQSSADLKIMTIDFKSPRLFMQSAIFQSLNKQNLSTKSIQNSQISKGSIYQGRLQRFEASIQKIQLMYNNFEITQESINKSITTGQEQKIDSSAEDYEQIKCILRSMLSYMIYKKTRFDILSDSDEDCLYMLKLQGIRQKMINQSNIENIFKKSFIRDYFNQMGAVKIIKNAKILQSYSPLISTNLKILNISSNKLTNLSLILDNIEKQNCIEFLNINFNMVKNISSVLLKLACIKQLHAHSNLIDHISGQNISVNNLLLLDLSKNNIEKQEDLSGLRFIKSLKILNLYQNPIIKLKPVWNNFFNRDTIFQINNLYLMSEYANLKDICFQEGSNDQETLQNKQKQNMPSRLSTKNKISKIKAYYEGPYI